MTEDSTEQKEQTFYWDGNVASMEEAGHGSYYMQDDLGSPMLFTDEEGEIRESYGYDEFGQSLYNYPERQLQPFGYTGYQMEAAGGLYFAQARRYDAGAGRFVSEDKLPGFVTEPHTMNRYSYCWNQPMEHVDLNGRFPWIIVAKIAVPIIVGAVSLMLTGCSSGERPPKDYREENSKYQNCYSYAFQLEMAARPGMYSYTGSNGYTNLDDRIYSLDEITEYVLRDMEAIGRNVRVIESPADVLENEYVVAMKTSTQRIPNGSLNADFHFAVLLSDGTWADKLGNTPSRWNKIDGTATSWDLGTPKNSLYTEGYYNTETVYFAVEECIE